jgi:hypothetical protein
MSFFGQEPPPPPPPEPEYRPPAWSGAPENVLPAAVAINAILARTDRVGVWISDARVYPTGLSFAVALVRREPQDLHDRPHHPFLMHGPAQDGDPRFGVAYADGRKAVAGAPGPRTAGEERSIVLSQGGGGGSQRRWEGRFWLWPLPPEGPLTFAFTWPEEGIGETTVEVDAGPIRDAAGHVVELWPDDRPLPPPPGESGAGGWQCYSGA